MKNFLFKMLKLLNPAPKYICKVHNVAFYDIFDVSFHQFISDRECMVLMIEPSPS